jgi:hypothetical protein
VTEGWSTGNKAITSLAATTSTAALACGVCCALPFAVPVALTGIFTSALALIERAYPWLTDVAVISVAAGWLSLLHRTRSTGRRPGGSTLALIALATAAMSFAVAWPSLERSVSAMLR